MPMCRSEFSPVNSVANGYHGFILGLGKVRNEGGKGLPSSNRGGHYYYTPRAGQSTQKIEMDIIAPVHINGR